jgi:hypothetical protein
MRQTTLSASASADWAEAAAGTAAVALSSEVFDGVAEAAAMETNMVTEVARRRFAIFTKRPCF